MGTPSARLIECYETALAGQPVYLDGVPAGAPHTVPPLKAHEIYSVLLHRTNDKVAVKWVKKTKPPSPA